jgi:hypothetical protein
VTTVAACVYDTGAEGDFWPERLISSVRIDGAAAAAAVSALAAAPVGGGPNAPATCVPEDAYGDRIMVLRIGSAAGSSRVHVRFAGCDHHGFDDGVRVRSLTRQAVAPLLAGPNTTLTGPTFD